jgi:hypothetical protein
MKIRFPKAYPSHGTMNSRFHPIIKTGERYIMHNALLNDYLSKRTLTHIDDGEYDMETRFSELDDDPYLIDFFLTSTIFLFLQKKGIGLEEADPKTYIKQS